MSKLIHKILIANRGEIAQRIRRTAQAIGIEVVAIYSDADADMAIVRDADQAIALGGISPAESYLDMDKVLAAAQDTGADAIHPGYGFLSENAEFARRVADAGLIFIGPSPEAIDAMGDKARAKRAMIAAGVPCIPGFQEDGATDAQLIAAAKDIGVPLMVKAASGGGGRGMRKVTDLKDLPDAIASARSEAENAFGSGELILEKLVTDARHVEVQVFADSHGTTVHLGERDCSVQRRHQKVIEEAPCPAVDEALRAKMGASAVRAAEAVNYEGAGTVEFLLADDGTFYFLEMNTRLQVEHPVTEMITGLDLVELQIKVAQGDPLGFTQDDVELNGHAIEARLYAEDPVNDFLPQSGDISQFIVSGTERIDTGLDIEDWMYAEQLQTISPAYDPMIAKVIVHADTRDAAVAKLRHALSKTLVTGVMTNRDFLNQVLDSETFRTGNAKTNWLDNGGLEPERAHAEDIDYQAAAFIFHFHRDDEVLHESIVPRGLQGWSNWKRLTSPYVLKSDEDTRTVNVRRETNAPDGTRTFVLFGCDGTDTPINDFYHQSGQSTVKLGKETWTGAVGFTDTKTLTLATPRGTFTFTDITGGEAQDEDGAGSGIIRAPMHGALLAITVAEGDTVTEGQTLGTLEAMKMQHPLRADVDGVVKTVAATPGAQVAAGDLLLEIEVGE